MRFFSYVSRWSYSPSPLSACFQGEIFIGGGGLLGGGPNKLLLEGPLKGAVGAPQPCTPPPDEAYTSNNCAEGVYTYHVGDAVVGAMLVARTAYGDGLFEDSEGRCYAVDGGALAVMSGALVPPALRLMAEAGKRHPFSLGHLVLLPPGAQVRATAKGGRLELSPLDGGQQQAPLLVLDTGDGSDGQNEEEGREATQGGFGETGDLSGSELLRVLRARPEDADLALEVCQVLARGLRSRMGKDIDEEGKAHDAVSEVLKAGLLPPLRLALEGHHRTEEVAYVGFTLLFILGKAGVSGFAQQVAPLFPAFAGALAIHEAGINSSRAPMAVIKALECVLEDDSSVAPAAAAAGLPAQVTAFLKSGLALEAANPKGRLEKQELAFIAMLALVRMAQVVPYEARDTVEALSALEVAAKAFPESELQVMGPSFLLEALAASTRTQAPSAQPPS